MKKVLLFLITLCFLFLSANADEIDRYISQSGIESKSTVGIYIEDRNTSHVLYKKNAQKLLTPASILKTLTFGASYMVLGENYEFETALYQDNQFNIYLKLGGDVLLSQNDLNNLIADLKTLKKIHNIYIDDSIIDKIPYPSGWMDDDMWPNMRSITPYIIDGNYTQISLHRSSLSTKIDILQDDDYKIPVINELKVGDTHSYKITRAYGENSSIVNFKGTISKDETLKLPVLRPEINFNIKLQKALAKNKIKYYKTITAKKIPKNAVKIACVSHSIDDVSKRILLNSDNFAAEVVFKVAAAKYLNYQKSASLDDAIEMFNCIFASQMSEGIKIADGSGVSRYNLVSAKFYNDAMKELFKKTNLKCLMATSNQGTLSNRLLFLEGNLRAKTGTLSQISSFAGTLTSKKNKDIIFTIIIQNSPKKKAILKNFENTLVGILYKSY